MTHTELNQKFKVTGTNARDFIKWAEKKEFKPIFQQFKSIKQ